MTRTIQILRGTEAQNDAFTGAVGELTMDTTNNEIRIHDGSTVGGHKIGGGRQTMPLLSFMWADHQLNDISWLRADTFSWQSGAVYTAVYQHLVDDIDGITAESETVGGITISFYRAPDGHKITTDESAVLSIYNATGVAWYYIIDTANQRFKLPRTKFGFNGLRDSVGNYVPESVPNIKGSFIPWCYGDGGTNGAFSNSGAGTNSSWGTQDVYGGTTISFDASDSASSYQDGAPVQQRATQMYLYFYVGNFTQTALENTAGLNASLFNNKADLNLLNTANNIDFVVESQLPTAGNNYTWYRKYRSGWVEQGGITSAVNGIGATASVTLPVEMSNANYSVYVTITRGNPDYRDQFLVAGNRAVTGFTVYSNWAGSGNGSQDNYAQWQVSGMAA